MSMCCHNSLTRFLCVCVLVWIATRERNSRESQFDKPAEKGKAESEEQSTVRTSEAKDSQLMVGEREK